MPDCLNEAGREEKRVRRLRSQPLQLLISAKKKDEKRRGNHQLRRGSRNFFPKDTARGRTAVWENGTNYLLITGGVVPRASKGCLKKKV